MADTIQLRRDTAANWVTANPVLHDGEIGIETDTRKRKCGNGTTAWNSLSYMFSDDLDAEPTANSHKPVESGGTKAAIDIAIRNNGKGAFDISAYKAVGGVLAKYDDLAQALGTNGANVPAAARKPGMSVCFVLNSDNKYVQYMYVGISTADVDFINVANWQKTNLEKEVIANSLYNLPVATGQTEPKYYTLAEAIAAVPESQRTSIKTIKFRTDSTTVILAQYQAGDYSSQNWNNLSNWNFVSNKIINNFINIHKLTGDNTPLSLYNAIRTIPDYARKCGLTIKFRSNVGRKSNQWIIETITATFCSADVSDTYFLNEDYWECEYNYNKNNVINLIGKGIRSDGTSGVEKVGDIYYNTGDRTIKRCTAFRSSTDFDEEIVPLANISKIFFAGVLQDYKDGELTYRYAEKNVHSLINLNKVLGNNDAYTFESALQAFASNFIGRRHLGVTLRYRVSSSPSIIEDATFMVGNTSDNFWNNKDNWNICRKTAVIPDTTWFALGDSITRGYYSANGSLVGITENNYPFYVSLMNNYKVINYGTGGSGYVHNATVNDNSKLTDLGLNLPNAKDIVDAVDFSTADIVSLAWGVNDWHYDNISRGDIQTSTVGDGTVVGNMRYVIEKILTDNPKTKIVAILPHNTSAFGGTAADNWGLGLDLYGNGTLQQFIDAEISVCEYYGIQYIDQTKNGIINRFNIQTLLPDGLHPAQDGYLQIARYLSKQIMFA